MFRAMTFLIFLSVVLLLLFCLFLIGRKFHGPNIRSVKTCALVPPSPLSPSVPSEAARLSFFELLPAWAPMCLIQWRALSGYFPWLVVLLFLIDGNDVC